MTDGAAPGGWTTGLCSCFDDCESCCLTTFCPFVAFGQVAETIDRGNTTCTSAGASYLALLCCQAACMSAGAAALPSSLLTYFTGCCLTGSVLDWIYSCAYRRQLRAQYGLPPEPCADCCVHFFCQRCALCQMYRELKKRGLDPSSGWAVNSQKMNLAPVPMQDMKR